MNKRGVFIISLDFELNWGVHDVFTLDQYGENLRGTREAIDQMLRLFSDYGIHATWATVGLLCFDNKKELLENKPLLSPSYENSSFSPYGKLKDIGSDEEEDPLHFGQSLVKKIIKVKGQEVASHTFSHYYCLEKGQTLEQFEEDLKASIKVKESLGCNVKTIIFPRNQVHESYLSICEKYGIESYRGNEKSWIYRESAFYKEGHYKRALRLVDSYINITGHNTYKLQKVDCEPVANLPSSRFLRPYEPRLKMFENLRLHRIKKSLRYAAKKNKVYHLWWHPHNFGKDLRENIAFLEEILKLAVKLNEQYGFQSLTMEEARRQINN